LIIITNTVNESMHEKVLKGFIRPKRLNNIQHRTTISSKVNDGPLKKK
jgi:hypothetical protein